MLLFPWDTINVRHRSRFVHQHVAPDIEGVRSAGLDVATTPLAGRNGAVSW